MEPQPLVGAPRAGVQVGRFELEAALGRGAVGSVWRARHLDTGTRAAVKLLSLEWIGSPGLVDAFEHEVSAVAALLHPNIVPLLDHGRRASSAGEIPWLAMEYVEGGAVQASRTWSWSDLRSGLLDLLEALAYAHARGVIHRDLKPGNVLLEGNRWKLADFGVAHRVGDHLGGDALIGTPSFMAPEQIRAEDPSLGPWTDLYGLGCLAWMLATGHPPFRGTGRLEVMASHLDRAPPRFEPRAPLPAGFEDWLRWLLEKEPRQRPLLAPDAASALRALHGPKGRGGSRTPPWTWRPPEPGRSDSERPRAVHLARASTAAFQVRHVPMVGREQERDRLWEALMLAIQRRRPQIVTLEGPLGSGKTRLVQWLQERACELGVAIPVTWGRELDVAEALAPWCTLLARERAADGHAACDHHEDAIAALCTRRPVVLGIDDAATTAEALAFLSGLRDQAAALPLVAILTLQPEDLERDPSAARLLAALPHRRIRVEPLPGNRLRELAGELLMVRGPVVDAIVERAGGSPRYVLELLRDWVDRGKLDWSGEGLEPARGAHVELPPSLRQVWAQRLGEVLERLPPSDGVALELGATLGARVRVPTWQTACGLLGVEPSNGLLHEAARAGLVRIDGAPPRAWALSHGMLRDALLARGRQAGRSASLHGACAEALARAVAPDARLPRGWAAIGHHLLRAERPAEAIDPLLSSLVHVDATSEHRLRDLLSALEANRTPEEDPRWGRAWNLAADVATVVGGQLDTVDWTELGVAAGLAHGWMPELVGALARQALRQARLGSPDDAMETARRALRLSSGLIPDDQLNVEISNARVAAMVGRHEVAAPQLERLAVHVAALGRRREAGTLALELVGVLRARGDGAPAHRWAGQARRWLEEAGATADVALCDRIMGDLARERGDIEAAERAYDDAARRQRPGTGPDAMRVELGRALTALAASDLDAARAHAEAVLLGARRRPVAVAVARLVIAHHELARGRLAEAVSLLDQVDDQAAVGMLTDGDLATVAAALAVKLEQIEAFEARDRALALAEQQYAAVGRTDLFSTPLSAVRRTSGPGGDTESEP